MPESTKTLVEEGYDQVAGAYSLLEGDRQWPRMKWLGKVLARLDPGSAVLDLGCGSGDPADIEIARLHRITGVDISNVQLELARQNVPQGDFIHGDLGALDFPDGSSMPWSPSMRWSTFPGSGMAKYSTASTAGCGQADSCCLAAKPAT